MSRPVPIARATARPASATPRIESRANAATPSHASTSAIPPSAPQWRWLTPARLGFLLAAIVLYAGWSLPTERLLSPERGLGYALGIVGGSAMLLLLLYPARKRMRWLGFLGTVKGWFQLHMVLGVVGPILVLYHSNFSLGATNSNAALVSMLLVAGSGIFGRYFYTRIHHGLYGRRATHAELQKAAEELREKVAGSRFVPELLEEIEAAERRLLRRPAGSTALLWRPLFVSGRMVLERWQLRRFARQRLRAAAAANPVLAQQHRTFEAAVSRYIGRRLEATRRLAEFESYERLFSLWHVLHLPLFLLLLVAGVVHVVAVHVY